MRARLLTAITFILIVSVSLFFFIRKDDAPVPESAPQKENAPIEVSIKNVENLRSASTNQRIPGIITTKNESTITASIAGTITSTSFELGKTITTGTLLARINEPSGTIVSKSGIRSDIVRQAEIAVSNAKKTYEQNKKVQEKAGSLANRLARDTAKLRLESAQIDLANAIDAHLIRSPIAGTVIEKNVTVGDSVTPGSVIARIASLQETVVKFSIPNSVKSLVSIGDPISVKLSDGNEVSTTITSISSIANPNTGNFSAEATIPHTFATAGNVVTIEIHIAEKIRTNSEFFLPLSAITTSQNGSFFFIAESNKAKKIPIDSLLVSGESASVSATLPENASIIIESALTLQDESPITVKK